MTDSEWLLIIAAFAVGLVLLILVGLAMAILIQLRRGASDPQSVAVALKDLTRGLEQEQAQVAVLGERAGQIQPLVQNVGSLQTDVRGLAERISTVERAQGSVNRGVGELANHSISALSELRSLTNQLASATVNMRAELNQARNDLTALHANARTRQEEERRMADSLRRLETVIAGTQSKGAAGENIVEAVFARLPVEWQVRNFSVGGRPVEFGLKLPNGLVLPIDSKWAATNLLEQFLSSEVMEEQQRLKREIENAVLAKAREVRKYIDPSITLNFGLAVIPDAVYDLCFGVLPDVFQMGVVLVSYSMLVPYLMLVFQTVLRSDQSVDLYRLEAYIQTVQNSTEAIQEELDGRFSRAMTMLSNSRDDIRAHASRASGSLSGLKVGGNQLGAIGGVEEADENLEQT
jgi:DNA recombination protein RmuC